MIRNQENATKTSQTSSEMVPSNEFASKNKGGVIKTIPRTQQEVRAKEGALLQYEGMTCGVCAVSKGSRRRKEEVHAIIIERRRWWSESFAPIELDAFAPVLPLPPWRTWSGGEF